MFGFGKKTNINKDEREIEKLLSRGVDSVIGGENLKKRLLKGEKLRVKFGTDPTSPNLHLGRSIPILKLQDFQKLGHQIVLIVGDFTGTIGDTSDKDSERSSLTREEVKQNMKTYIDQISKLLDISKVEINYNSKWLEKLNFSQIGDLARIFSINQFISRDLISKRLKKGKRVSLQETLYPLMQGYDSVAIKSDVEIGGTDQLFNMLAGRDIQKHFGQKEQSVITGPIVEGSDGRKMSSSWGNTINFTDSPSEMYGKVMSVRDESVINYFTLLTRTSIDEISNLEKQILVDPKNTKMKLAEAVVSMYHSEAGAEKAKKDWQKTFSQGGVPEDVQEISVDGGENLIDVFIENNLLPSKTEFRRRYKAGAIKNAGSGEKAPEIITDSTVIKYGKKNFIKITVK
jgi:tyrosyl-tRNA synthetase